MTEQPTPRRIEDCLNLVQSGSQRYLEGVIGQNKRFWFIQIAEIGAILRDTVGILDLALMLGSLNTTSPKVKLRKNVAEFRSAALPHQVFT